MTQHRADGSETTDSASHGHPDAWAGLDGLSIPVVTCTPGASPTVCTVNAVFETAFGTDEDAVVGQSVVDALAATFGQPLDEVETAVREARAGERPVLDNAVSGEADARGEDDQVTERSYRLTHHTGPTDNAPAALLFDEVTAQKRRIRELESERDRLVMLVHSFVHDLRNPLEVASIRLDAARKTGDDSHLDELEHAHDRIGRLTDEMRSLADEGTVDDEETVDTDVEQVARDAWNLVDTGDATLELAESLPTVRAVPSRLQRLFENLFRNCVQHAATGSRPQADPSGDSDSRVSAEGTTAPRVRVRPVEDGFAVEDDGPGISAEEHDAVFDRGYTTSEDGTGLGLSIVRQVANGHGWQVSIDESEWGGTQVRVAVS